MGDDILYIHVHPSREEYADGFAAALNTYPRDDQYYEVVVNVLCPPGKLYIHDTKEFVNPGTDGLA